MELKTNNSKVISPVLGILFYLIISLGLITSPVSAIASTNLLQTLTNPKITSSDLAARIQAEWVVDGVNSAVSITSKSMTIDPNGNIYIVGYFQNAASSSSAPDFGNGVTLSATGATLNKAFIVKYNSAGIAQWAIRANGSIAEDVVESLAFDVAYDLDTADGLEYVYMTGYFDCQSCSDTSLDNMTFGGVAVASTNGNKKRSGTDMFLIKIRISNGTVVWARKEFYSGSVNPNNNVDIESYSVAQDPTSNSVYIVGSYKGTNRPYFSNRISVKASSRPSDPYLNSFITKFNSSGIPQWSRRGAGTNTYNVAKSVIVDSTGNPIIVGEYSTNTNLRWNNSGSKSGGTLLVTNAANLGPSAGPAPRALCSGGCASEPGLDMYVTKFTSKGVARWSIHETNAASITMSAYAIDLDVSDNIYLTGIIEGTGTFDICNVTGANCGTYSTNNSPTVSTGFTSKYTSAGSPVWVNIESASGSSEVIPQNIYVDRSTGSTYTTGYYRGEGLNFGNGVTLPAAQNRNLFVVKFDNTGLAVGAKTEDSTTNGADVYGQATHIYQNDVYITGFFKTDDSNPAVNFGNGIPSISQNNGVTDMFLVKYNQTL